MKHLALALALGLTLCCTACSDAPKPASSKTEVVIVRDPDKPLISKESSERFQKKLDNYQPKTTSNKF